jgi:ATPase subunit of ABC transporter with duplicated ATPase domains
MLTVSNLGKWFADRVILQGVSFTVSAGERLGIVGPNGCGKTTQLSILAGQLPPDEGSVSLAPGARLGYLRQGYLGDDLLSVQALLAPADAVLAAHAAMLAAGEALAAAPQHGDLPAYYGRAVEAFEQHGGYQELDRIQTTLRGLDLDRIDPARLAATLSGGQKTRLALAGLLLREPDLLLLDEPTNHLDVDGLRTLEGFLQRFRGAALIVSHDRTFLDATAQAILELRGETHTAARYTGGYTAYAAAKQHELADQQDRYARQQRERARIEEEVRGLKDRARATEQRGRDAYDHGDTRGKKQASKQRAAKAARTAVVHERKLERRLDEETIAKPRAGWTLKLDFAPVPGGAREVLQVDHLRKGFGESPVLQDISLLLRHGERLVITGPNGGGKSTLLKIIAGTLTADAGSVRLGAGVIPGFFSQEQEVLDPRQTPLSLLRSLRPMDETEARTLLHAYLFSNDMVFTPIGRLSYGERARLALARLVADRATLLLLDEPTNHLDIPSRERFEAALAGFQGTIIAVLHDRYAIRRLATRVLDLREGLLALDDPRSFSHTPEVHAGRHPHQAPRRPGS